MMYKNCYLVLLSRESTVLKGMASYLGQLITTSFGFVIYVGKIWRRTKDIPALRAAMMFAKVVCDSP